MSLIFGRLTQDFVSFQIIRSQAEQGLPEGVSALPEAIAHFKRTAALDASYLVYIGIALLFINFRSSLNLIPGVAMFFANLIYMAVWTHTSEVGAKRLRETYLASILRQDVAFFDNVGAGEIATRIETDTREHPRSAFSSLIFILFFLDLVQQGISEKIPLAVSFLSAFVTGFVLAYIRQWKLALAMTSIIPMISFTFALMNRFISKYMQESLKHIGEGGSLAEEVISTIRTSHAFGSQNVLHSLYNNYVLKARTVELKSAVWQGSSLGVMFFAIYASYALAFQFGTTLINSGEGTNFLNIFVFFVLT